MENEIMIFEDDVMEIEPACVDCDAEGSGMSTGMAMAIGAGLTLAVGAAVKAGKWLYGKYKAHKELKRPKDGEVIEVTQDEIEEVTKKPAK